MKGAILFVTCVLGVLVTLAECGSQKLGVSELKQPVASWEVEKQHQDHMQDELRSREVQFRFRGGHGHTGQKVMEDCPTGCTFDLRPVCGSDGETYDNKCLLAMTACKQEKRIHVEKDGPC